MKYLLDTSVLLLFFRYEKIYEDQKRKFNFFNENTFISSVSVGELLAIGLYRKWKSDTIKNILKKIEKFHIIDVNFYNLPFLETYAKVDAFSRCIEVEGRANKKGFTMGKNDLWISASAVIAGCELVTADKDFTHLDPAFFKVHYVAQRQK